MKKWVALSLPARVAAGISDVNFLSGISGMLFESLFLSPLFLLLLLLLFFFFFFFFFFYFLSFFLFA